MDKKLQLVRKAIQIINTKHDIVDAEGMLHPKTDSVPAKTTCPECGQVVLGLWMPTELKTQRREMHCPRGTHPGSHMPVCGHTWRATLVPAGALYPPALQSDLPEPIVKTPPRKRLTRKRASGGRYG